MATAIVVGLAGDATPPEYRQQSFRAHNNFVGAALGYFQAHEIHNHGKGVIADFDDASLAVPTADANQSGLLW
jgi:hypothetical protein